MGASDDLEQVFVSTGLDRAVYRSYPLHLQARSIETRRNDELGGDSGGTPHSLLGEGYGARQSVGLETPPKPIPQREHRSTMLNGLLSNDKPRRDETSSKVNTISVIGAAGGVGTTTISACLARIFSQRGRRVLLLDGEAESLLPLYLGAGHTSSAGTGSWSFVPHADSRQGTVSVVACGGTESNQPRLPWACAREFRGIANEIILDCASHFISQKLPIETSGTLLVIVLVPDIRCALQVRNLERIFAECPDATAPFYLLNQFDPSISLHQEMAASLSRHVGERLSPVKVRRSHEVPQALAEGLTVVDHAHSSLVSNDIFKFADWLKQVATAGAA